MLLASGLVGSPSAGGGRHRRLDLEEDQTDVFELPLPRSAAERFRRREQYFVVVLSLATTFLVLGLLAGVLVTGSTGAMLTWWASLAALGAIIDLLMRSYRALQDMSTPSSDWGRSSVQSSR